MNKVYQYFFENKEMSPPTRKHYLKISRTFNIPLEDVTRKTVRDYYSNLNLKSKHQYLNGLSSMVQFYIDDNLLNTPNPFRAISKAPSRAKSRAESLSRVLTKDQREALKMPLTGPEEKYRLTALFQLHSGFSWVDLGNPHVKFEKKIIVLRRGKNAQESIIPLTKELKEIWDQLKEFPFEQFVTVSFEKVDKVYQREYRRYNRFLKKFGITTHSLRKTYAQDMLDSGKWSLEDVSCFLGHSSVLVTERAYASVGKERILNKLSTLSK